MKKILLMIMTFVLLAGFVGNVYAEEVEIEQGSTETICDNYELMLVRAGETESVVDFRSAIYTISVPYDDDSTGKNIGSDIMLNLVESEDNTKSTFEVTCPPGGRGLEGEPMPEEEMMDDMGMGATFAPGASNNNMLYIILAVIVIAAIGGYLYTKKK